MAEGNWTSPPPSTAAVGRHQNLQGHWGVAWQVSVEEAPHAAMAVMGSPSSRGGLAREQLRVWNDDYGERNIGAQISLVNGGHDDYAERNLVGQTSLANGGEVIAEDDDSEETREDGNHQELHEGSTGRNQDGVEEANGHEQEEEGDEPNEAEPVGVGTLDPNWLGHYQSMIGSGAEPDAGRVRESQGYSMIDSSVEQEGGRVRESQGGLYEACPEDNDGNGNGAEADEGEEEEEEEEEEEDEDEEDDEEHEKRMAAGHEFIERQMAGECVENSLHENASNHNSSWSQLQEEAMEGCMGGFIEEERGEREAGDGVPLEDEQREEEDQREVDEKREEGEEAREGGREGEEEDLMEVEVREPLETEEEAPLPNDPSTEHVAIHEEGATEQGDVAGKGRPDVEASDKAVTDGSGSREHDGEEREEAEGQGTANASSAGADVEMRQAGVGRKRKLNGNMDVSDDGVTVTRRVKKKGSGGWSRVGKRGAKRGGSGKGGGAVSNQRVTHGRSNMDGHEVSNMVALNPAPNLVDPEERPGEPIVLSKTHKASQIQLGPNGLSATSWKGYRMVRATRGVVDGAWYFEIKVDHLGETGHTRLGWCNQKGDVQAPVGYDKNGYAYRDLEGVKVHEGYRLPYGDPYTEGDIVGCLINLPDGARYAPQPSQLNPRKGPCYLQEDRGDEPLQTVPGSEIMFFKNGLCQGVAFKDIYAGQYFPAASLYTLPMQTEGCSVSFNFGPEFWFPPPRIVKDDGVEVDHKPMSRAPSFVPAAVDPGNPFENGGSSKELHKSGDGGSSGEQTFEKTSVGGGSAGACVMMMDMPGGGGCTAPVQEKNAGGSGSGGWNSVSADTPSNGPRVGGAKSGPKKPGGFKGESKTKGISVGGAGEGSVGGGGEEDESVETGEREVVTRGGEAMGQRRDSNVAATFHSRKGGVPGSMKRAAGGGQGNRIGGAVLVGRERPGRGGEMKGGGGAGVCNGPAGSWGVAMATVGKSKPRSSGSMERALHVASKKVLGKTVGKGRGAMSGAGLKTKGLAKNLQDHGLKVKGLKRIGVK